MEKKFEKDVFMCFHVCLESALRCHFISNTLLKWMQVAETGFRRIVFLGTSVVR